MNQFPLIALRYFAILLLLHWIAIGPYTTAVGVVGKQAPIADDKVRPCKNPIPTTKPQKQSPKKKSGQLDLDVETLSACIEVRSGVLEVQEVLQAKVRELQWSIHDENLTESSWRFMRELTKNELLSMTREETSQHGVEWNRGRATIQVVSTGIEDGYTRTVVQVQFRGYGETRDKLVTPRDWWAMDSNGSLEESLLEVLRKHFVPKNK